MEDILFQIYGTLILTLAGFVLPIIAIAISAFPEGIKVLRQAYENERVQAETNLDDELRKSKANGEVDLDLLARNIKGLKKSKRRAKNKLLYLNPHHPLLRSAIAVGVTLISFLCGLLLYKYSCFKEKIIRFNYNYIQSRQNTNVGSINLTFLKTGSYNVVAFVKAENLKNKYVKFIIQVID